MSETPVAAVPPTPSAPVDQSGPHGVAESIDRIAREAIAQTLQESEPAEQPRDEKGRFTPKAEAAAPPAAEVPVAEGEPVAEAPVAEGEPEAEPEAPALPEGFVAVPKADRELAAKFTLSDKDGELEIPDVTVRFTANGKERAEPLDKVVKLAQFGIYNHEKEQAMQARAVEAQRIAQENAELRAYIERVESGVEQLMGSDEAYLNARAKWEAANTPEARAQRTLAEAQRLRDEARNEQVAYQGQQFVTGTLEPAIQQIATALPTVSPEEIAARVLLLVEPFKQNGVVPPQAYQRVSQAVLDDVVPWAQMLHDSRDSSRRTETAKSTQAVAAAKQEADRAKIAAQKARSTVAKVVKPVGVAQKPTPPAKPIKNVDDAMEAAIADTLRATAGAA